MNRQRSISVILSGLLIVIFCQISGADDAKEQAAIAASGAWLMLMDEGNYAESWDRAASLFRAVLTREQWEKMSTAVRAPLGKVLSRTIMSNRYATSLPGAPDGEYVVIQYRTSFEHKKEAVETVTPMMDRDGTWRVSGYYIK